jgi:hypothetical protein
VTNHHHHDATHLKAPQGVLPYQPTFNEIPPYLSIRNSKYSRRLSRLKKAARSGESVSPPPYGSCNESYNHTHYTHTQTNTPKPTELDPRNWTRLGYSRFNFWIDPDRDNVPRISYDDVSEEEFIERFEAPGVPVVIEGITKQWPASTEWTPEVCFLFNAS